MLNDRRARRAHVVSGAEQEPEDRQVDRGRDEWIWSTAVVDPEMVDSLASDSGTSIVDISLV
jgi:hypothetical protein